MVDPRLALAVFGVGLALLVLLLRPRGGVLWRVVRRARRSRRESIEDALKHLYKARRFGQTPTLESVAGALGTSTVQAAQLIERMHTGGLVDGEGVLRLTPEGERYALQVIRTHRLWERYLADRTGVEPGAWHELAEAREHELTLDEVDALSARLGHPRFDPHGDPIPTAAGEIPAPIGRVLAEMPVGDGGRIAHIEDEPQSVYDRLLRAGLHPGMRIDVRARDAKGVIVAADGDELTLDPLAAANVTVALEGEIDPGARAATLASLAPGQHAEVLGLSPACQGSQRRRLLDLGVVPGTVITAEFASASRDPMAFRIRGALIALRRGQQRWIRVRPVGAGPGDTSDRSAGGGSAGGAAGRSDGSAVA